MELRYYQQDAVNTIVEYYNSHVYSSEITKSLVVMPTGCGKTFVIADIVRMFNDVNARICILTHRSELIEQNKVTLQQFIGETADIGIYCAKLNRYDIDNKIIIASIQSIGKKAHLFPSGFDLTVIDEVHLLSDKKETLYQQFLNALWLDNKGMFLLGLTATPYRMGFGYIYEGDNALFNSLTYEVSVAELMYEEYLAPLVSIKGEKVFDIQGVKLVGGEFVAKQMNEKIEKQHQVFESAIEEIMMHGQSRKSWVVFTNSVKQVDVVCRLLSERGIDCCSITGDTPQDEREDVIERFKAGEIKCIVNCKVLTTGFDAPNIDLIVLLMATASPSLYVQIMGRGTRKAKGKENCLVLDYGGNVERHGCIDDVTPKKKGDKTGEAPTKDCPKCNAIVALRTVSCPYCHYLFSVPDEYHLNPAYCGQSLATKKYMIRYIEAKEHQKEGKPPCVRVNYYVDINGKRGFISEYFSPESSDKARFVCNKIFKERYKTDMPDSVEQSIQLIYQKPIPRYILSKVNDSGFFVVNKVGFD